MSKFLSSPILKIILLVFLIPALVVNFLMAYIIFAPDTFPKPFYLMYTYPVVEEAPPEGEGSPEPEAESSGEEDFLSGEASDHGIMYDTGTKIINLAEPTGRRYIRVNIVLEFLPTDPGYLELEHEEQTHYLEEFDAEVNSRLPVINDSLISIFSSKTFEDVYTADGKEMIRQEIQLLLNERLADYTVMNIYFTEFVVQ